MELLILLFLAFLIETIASYWLRQPFLQMLAGLTLIGAVFHYYFNAMIVRPCVEAGFQCWEAVPLYDGTFGAYLLAGILVFVAIWSMGSAVVRLSLEASK